MRAGDRSCLSYNMQVFNRKDTKTCRYLKANRILICWLLSRKTSFKGRLTSRDILLISQKGSCHVIGKKQAEYIKLNIILVDGKDYIVTEGIDGPNYFNSNKQQAYWPNTFPDNHFKFPVSKLAYSYSISQELKELVKHNFKSEEEIRFSKQQFVAWFAIGVSLLLGILGVIF